MKTVLNNHVRSFCLGAGACILAGNLLGQNLIVKPARGGGLDTNAPMIHADIFYDYGANQMHATLGAAPATPKLVPLPPGYALDATLSSSVLSNRAYNFQYAWNPGGLFTNPPGAAVWIECVSMTPGLECYDGPGNKTISPPRTYEPIFATAGSSTRWKWYGSMAHNSYAVLNPTNPVVTAQYRVYFGDAVTGDPEAFASYGNALVTLTWDVDPVVIVKPARGGGLDTNAPMIHADIFYDYGAKQMRATLGSAPATPRLIPLPAGYAFDAATNYAVLNGKAYNFQYAWNPGGLFTNPPGAAVWIERVSASPGLECYDGPGNKMLSTPRDYAPIFGTAGSSTRWKWYEKMAHNSYAVLNPTDTVVTAQYRVYFGDETTGAPEAFASYGNALATFAWQVDLPVTPVFRFGAIDETGTSPLSLLNASDWTTNSLAVVNLHYTNGGPGAFQYESPATLVAVPASALNGGPETNHAAPGARLELQVVSLTGPAQGRLSFWENGQSQPCVTLATGEQAGTNCLGLSQSQGEPGADPYGCLPGRRVTATQPGLYCLGFRVVDTSTNGVDGGPIHGASQVYYVYLQAGLLVDSLTRQGSSTTALFGGEAARTFYLERTPVVGPNATWQTVAGPLTGTSRLQSLTDPVATAAGNFYRLRYTVP